MDNLSFSARSLDLSDSKFCSLFFNVSHWNRYESELEATSVICASRSRTLRSLRLRSDSATSAWCLVLESCSTMLSLRLERIEYFCFVSESVALVSLSSVFNESMVVWRFSMTLDVPEVGWWEAMTVCVTNVRSCFDCLGFCCACWMPGAVVDLWNKDVAQSVFICIGRPRRQTGRELRGREIGHKSRAERREASLLVSTCTVVK